MFLDIIFVENFKSIRFDNPASIQKNMWRESEKKNIFIQFENNINGVMKIWKIVK